MKGRYISILLRYWLIVNLRVDEKLTYIFRICHMQSVSIHRCFEISKHHLTPQADHLITTWAFKDESSTGQSRRHHVCTFKIFSICEQAFRLIPVMSFQCWELLLEVLGFTELCLSQIVHIDYSVSVSAISPRPHFLTAIE